VNNEPVAWIGKNELQFGFTDTIVTNEKESWDDIPLYTHPADESFDRTASHMAGEYVSYPAKTLTDEEIEQIGKETMLLQFFQTIEATADHGDSIARAMTAMIRQQAFDFARAILRKAQEK